MAHEHNPPTPRRHQPLATPRRAFSLVELTIVIVIIGILAAMAIPRLSRGSAGAAEAALKQNLAIMRQALHLCAAEHGGVYPDVHLVVSALTRKTAANYDDDGRNPACVLGPYLVKIPPLPVGARAGQTGITTSDDPTAGWFYLPDQGDIRANTTDDEVDADGVKYSDY